MLSTAMRAAAFVLITGAGLAGLTSCALLDSELAPSATPIPTTSSPSLDAPEPVEDTVDAVVTVASIDVDGQHVSASGYVSGVVEDGGACRFTFTSDVGEVVVESTGISDVSATSCGLISEPSTSFVRGTWSVTLTYLSQTANSVSEPVALEIP